MAINTWLTWMTGECQEYTNDIIQGVKNNVAAQFEWQKNARMTSTAWMSWIVLKIRHIN